MADYLTKKEASTLNGEIKQKEEILEVEKFMFARKLQGDLGNQIKEQLENPKKPSKILGLKYRYARWKTIRDGKREEKKIKREIKKGDR